MTNYAKRAREIKEEYEADMQVAHIKLDELLLDALREHGEEEELAEEFEDQHKWYA